MFRVLAIIACFVVYVAIHDVAYGQQAQPSCEEQLAQMQTTLMFVRSWRNLTEESVGRVVATLQQQLDTLQHEMETLKKVQAAPVQHMPKQEHSDTKEGNR